MRNDDVFYKKGDYAIILKGGCYVLEYKDELTKIKAELMMKEGAFKVFLVIDYKKEKTYIDFSDNDEIIDIFINIHKKEIRDYKIDIINA